jgi:hypothetical protein
MRFVDNAGNQIVAIGRYAYVWAGAEPLKVGDVVELPGNWTTGFEPYRGAVTALGTGYNGPLDRVVRRV